MYTEIETAYASSNDITFIMRHTFKENGDPISTECVGWYYGEPNKEDTEYFQGKLKGTYEL